MSRKLIEALSNRKRGLRYRPELSVSTIQAYSIGSYMIFTQNEQYQEAQNLCGTYSDGKFGWRHRPEPEILTKQTYSVGLFS